VLDLRSDGTYFDVEYALVDAGDGNTETGVSQTFGTYKFTKDSHGHRYIRFQDGLHAEYSWRWRFEPANGGTATLKFVYATGEVGFQMKRSARPTATFLGHLHDKFATATLTPIADPQPSHWTGELPNALPARVLDLKLANQNNIAAYSLTIDSTKLFVLEYGANATAKIEVYSHDSQLLARSKTVTPLVWAELHP
jgi:hypothetical protein